MTLNNGFGLETEIAAARQRKNAVKNATIKRESEHSEQSWPASAAVTLNIIDVPGPKKGIEV